MQVGEVEEVVREYKRRYKRELLSFNRDTLARTKVMWIIML
jgi:hypothetical protein